MEHTYYLEMQQLIDRMLMQNSFYGKRIFIMGHCEAAEKLIRYLLEKQITVKAIIDNNKGKQGTACMGIPIEEPGKQLLPYQPDTLILIISRHYESMAEQLRSMGYDNQIVRVVDYDSFSEFSLTDETFERKAKRVREGIAFLSRIKEEFPDRQIVIGPYNALGDVCMVCCYLREYCKKQQTDDKNIIWIVTGNGCRQIPPMFGYERVMALSGKEMDALVQAVIFTADESIWILHHDRPYTNVNIRISEHYPVVFEQHYPCSVFGMYPECNKEKPMKTIIKKEFMGLVKGKTVILSPYAKSIMTGSRQFWENIASDWKHEGFHVVTNTAGKEMPVAGTEKIELELGEMIPAAEYAGYFIGIRNGLCDVIESAACSKKVVFPNEKYSTTNLKIREFFFKEGFEEYKEA